MGRNGSKDCGANFKFIVYIFCILYSCIHVEDVFINCTSICAMRSVSSVSKAVEMVHILRSKCSQAGEMSVAGWPIN